jgi:hypothetical protein
MEATKETIHVKIVSKAIRVACAGGLIAGVMAVGHTSADAAVVTVATCDDFKGLATIKSDTVGQGITDLDNESVAVSGKGVDDPKGSKVVSGDCSFASGLSTPDSGKPALIGYNGTKQVGKWSIKLTSPEADCNVADTGDNTEWPLNGALSVEFEDLNNTGKPNKLAGVIVIDGFTDPDDDPDTPSDVVEARGFVTKGVAVGADITQQSAFDPVIKDKTQTTNFPYYGYQFDLLGALGCTTPAAGDANVTGALIGDLGGTSAILALPIADMQLTIGTP